MKRSCFERVSQAVKWIRFWSKTRFWSNWNSHFSKEYLVAKMRQTSEYFAIISMTHRGFQVDADWWPISANRNKDPRLESQSELEHQVENLPELFSSSERSSTLMMKPNIVLSVSLKVSNSSSSDKVFPNCLSGLDLFPNDKLRVVRPSPANVLFAFVSPPESSESTTSDPFSNLSKVKLDAVSLKIVFKFIRTKNVQSSGRHFENLPKRTLFFFGDFADKFSSDIFKSFC